MAETVRMVHRSGPGRLVGAPGARILIVDDEPHICEILSRWLDADGYICHSAYSAEQGLEAMADEDFDLVILDIMLPGMSGIEMMPIIGEKFPDVAVVIVTAVDARQTAVRAVELGAYGYIIKPFQQNEVVINVINALERHSLVQLSRHYEARLEEKVRKQTLELRQSREDIVLRLTAAQQYRHDETGAHVRRMGLYSEALGQQMGHPEEYTYMLRLAAPMHDVGKIGVPDSILLKPGKLTGEEFEIMKNHTTIGGRILMGSQVSVVRVSAHVALRHHERWDGSGYPGNMAGREIPEPARIVAILDVYDALVHDRVYRPALSEDEAIGIMTPERGTHFDPDVFDAFLQALPLIRDIRDSVRDEGQPGTTPIDGPLSS